MSSIESQAADRIDFMGRAAKRWFWSNFEANCDLHESDVADFINTTPDWVCGDADLTPLGREVWRQLRLMEPA